MENDDSRVQQIFAMEPRHGGARKGFFQWVFDARDYADGTIPVHPKAQRFRMRWRAAAAMRKQMLRRPDVEMRVIVLPGDLFGVLNEHYEMLGKRKGEWYPVGRKVGEPAPVSPKPKPKLGRPPGRTRHQASKAQDVKAPESTTPETKAPTKPRAPVPEPDPTRFTLARPVGESAPSAPAPEPQRPADAPLPEPPANL